jgi:hypothetical protein
MKIYWENEDNIEAARERMKKMWAEADAEFRKNHSKNTKLACNTPEMKSLRSDNGKKLWEDPGYKEKQMDTRKSEEFSIKMSISLQEHIKKRAVIRQEKSLKCREVFVRHDGDTQKVVDELKVSKWTIAEWLKPYCNDEEIISIKKQRRKDLCNTPEAKERLLRANKASVESKARAKSIS